MLLAALGLVCFAMQDPAPAPVQVPSEPSPEAARRLAIAELIGLELTPAEVSQLAGELAGQLRSYRGLRAQGLDNTVAPALTFSPLVPGVEPRPHGVFLRGPSAPIRVAEGWEESFWDLSIPELGWLLREGRTTCLELTDLHLARLAALDTTLHCVVTLLPERARAQARQLDAELAAGKDRGPLHGIPWGAKDLLAVAGAPTTWGAAPYKDQVFDADAAVVRRLDEAGAVLIAKLSLGALAMGDVWFGGKTRNPWEARMGSSGSSAGSAAAVAAGGVAFAIGSETLGSIVSPSVRCGVTAVRPSFGRVSRAGAMSLSWSMDKLGPMARSFVDVGLVLQAITGPGEHELDPAAQIPAAWPATRAGEHTVRGLKVGAPRAALEAEDPALLQALDELRQAQAARGLTLEVVPFDLPEAPLDGMLLGLMAEAAAAFDDLTLGGADDELVSQGANDWPNLFRAARLIPAVEYVNAQRHRTLLIRELESRLQEVDLLVHPPFAAGILSATNLTGHPTLVAPLFLAEPGQGGGYPGPKSICFTGRLFDEGFLLAVAERWQAQARHHQRHPHVPLPASDATEQPADPGEASGDR
ncbi:MAG: amidase [Planctomycetota bacterium]|nr:amidase [Planctomycetota bacterium]